MQSTRIRTTLLRCTPVIFLFTLVACGGSGNNLASALTTSNADDIPAAAKEEVAAAASAAATENVPAAISMKVQAAAVKDDSMTDQFIVKYKDGTAERKNTTDVEKKLNRLSSAFPAQAHHKRRMGIGADVITSERKLNATEAKAFMRAIASDPDVEYVEPDTQFTIQMVPNDSYYSQQWHLVDHATSSAPAGIRAPGAWDLATGRGVVIGVLDTGVTHHSDLDANMLPGFHFLSGEGGPGGMNDGIASGQCVASWHGDHVAGIAAAVTNNANGIAGVAPDAKVVSVNVMGPCGHGPTSAIADGVTWAAGGVVSNYPVNPNPAKVINMSISQWNFCPVTMQRAIDDATSRGAIVVVASGNNRADAANFTPGNCRNVINVAATSYSGGDAGFSNYGSAIDIAAPGENILSTFDDGVYTPGNETYIRMSGTSMAAPVISGVIALMKSVEPKPLSVGEYRAILQQTAQPFGPEKTLVNVGAGIVDAKNAVAAAKAGVIPVSADFSCTQYDLDFMRIICSDKSTHRGGASISSWAWNSGRDGAIDQIYPDSSYELLTEYENPGAYSVRLTVTDVNGKKSSFSRPVQVNFPQNIISVSANTPVPISTGKNDVAYYKIVLPKGVNKVTATAIFKNSNDYVSLGLKNMPSFIKSDCYTAGMGNRECTVKSPPGGDYYATVSVSNSQKSGTFTISYE